MTWPPDSRATSTSSRCGGRYQAQSPLSVPTQTSPSPDSAMVRQRDGSVQDCAEPERRFALFLPPSPNGSGLGLPGTSWLTLAFAEPSTHNLLDARPWPESWGENWYETDDLYIDYDSGYYLNNRQYPGFRWASGLPSSLLSSALQQCMAAIKPGLHALYQ
jgi:hypothetical protein